MDDNEFPSVNIERSRHGAAGVTDPLTTALESTRRQRPPHRAWVWASVCSRHARGGRRQSILTRCLAPSKKHVTQKMPVVMQPRSGHIASYRECRPRPPDTLSGAPALTRRTHSSLMRDKNVDPKVVADQLGHTLDVNLNVYTQTSLERKIEAVESLEAFVSELKTNGAHWGTPNFGRLEALDSRSGRRGSNPRRPGSKDASFIAFRGLKGPFASLGNWTSIESKEQSRSMASTVEHQNRCSFHFPNSRAA
jgi:hypothetical protein